MLFTGFMLTPDGPKVLEYNVRFGDPETQALMLLLDDATDLAEVMLACVERRLDSVKLGYREGYAVSVVLASEGYPGSYPKGIPMTIPPSLIDDGIYVFHAGTAIKDNTGVTDGGRVLAVCAASSTLRKAVDLAYKGVGQIEFQGKTFRRDIAYRALQAESSTLPPRPASPNPVATTWTSLDGLTYAAAGVSVDAGNALVEAIKPVVKATRRPGADASIGGFGGSFDLAAVGYKDPILVSGTDGVGTKLKVALTYNKHSTVGIDLVAMSVNDLIVQGAEPLYFLDYFACSKLNVDTAADVITGIAEGCLAAGCALIGGETAEMPGMYIGDEYDLAGFAVGVVEREQILPKNDLIKSGDAIIGLPSSGPHSNGFSLIRKVISMAGLAFEDKAPWSSSNETVGDALLVPTQIYIKQLLPGIKTGLYKGMSHITGGGFTENIPRIFEKDSTLGVQLDLSSWQLPALWKWLMKTGGVLPAEMARTFNCGVGMVIIVDQSNVEAALSSLRENGEPGAFVMGQVKEGTGVAYTGFESWQ